MHTETPGWRGGRPARLILPAFLALVFTGLAAGSAAAHNVTAGDAGYIQEI